jgi:predicted AlkP superfamily pyrophosphatase or phosphodiesterase
VRRLGATLGLVLVIVFGGLATVAQRIPTDDRTPNLIVLLVVDQFRADYIDTYHQQWSRGLRRLITEGAWFRQAYYPYLNTVTCAGHVSISTGAVPALHGAVLNEWWERSSGKKVTCTEDARYTPLSYGRTVTAATGESAGRFLLPALADELRAQHPGRGHTIAVSLKPRSAIPLGGHKPDAVVWFDDNGSWMTSTAFSAGPVPAVAEFVRRNPIEADFGNTWDLALRPDAYLYEDTAVGLQAATKGMTPSFPHVLKGNGDAPDRMFYDQWQSSPFADEYLVKMTLGVADSLRFATLPGPNLIGIGFATLDKVGHDYGPHSREVQDTLIRLDRTLGDLFAGLDRLVGPGRYTVALSADHGVAPAPERLLREGIEAGRIDRAALLSAAAASLTTAVGPGTHVATMLHNYLYLEPGVYEQLQAKAGAMRAVLTDLAKVPGVLRAYSRDELEADRFVTDTIGQQAALSYVAGRSGDLMVVWKPYWFESLSTSQHGSGYQYDTHVPLLLMGTGIAKGEYLTRVSPTDIAPTLAFLAGITLPRASGRVLTEALTRMPSVAKPPQSEGWQ